jgi:excisionase family DNA binding protein
MYPTSESLCTKRIIIGADSRACDKPAPKVDQCFNAGPTSSNEFRERNNIAMHETRHHQSLTLSTPEITVTLSTDALQAIAAAAGANLQSTQVGESPYLTVREAATYIRASPQRIYDLLSSRRLPKYKDGRRVLIRRSDLDQYLELHPRAN